LLPERQDDGRTQCDHDFASFTCNAPTDRLLASKIFKHKTTEETARFAYSPKQREEKPDFGSIDKIELATMSLEKQAEAVKWTRLSRGGYSTSLKLATLTQMIG
jgi:hypothetical protein